MKVGVDTGGTFTDVVGADGRSTKVLSSPDDPALAVADGVASLGAGRPELLAHGTTVATNALLERRGAGVALVTTEGLADVIEIARQDRPSLYDQLADRPSPLVPRGWRYEVSGRLAADGSELAPVDVASLPPIDPDVEAVAVCLLHADLNPDHEEAVAVALRGRGVDVTCSYQVSPEMREYERTVTTVINASLRPRIRDYLRRLTDLADEVLVMTSAGGLLPAVEAADLPAALLLSGPAGGVRAGAAVAAANGFPDAVTFDMGGTSTDVCLILDGAPAPAAQRDVGGFTVRFPSLDVHTIGAGGGSIARLDPGGALVVGPQSAGADPGPACYGRGGVEATVTDANLVAGRIPADAAFGGLRLDRGAAEAALARAGVSAEGVLEVVDANMERALRAVSVERGVDPRGLALVAFGGAGPLHATALADALGMPAVVVPGRAGVLSAVGVVTAPRRRDVVRSWPRPDSYDGLVAALDDLAAEARALVPEASGVAVALDCRYRGQSHELTVPFGEGWIDAFHDEHVRRNGYARSDQPVEVVALRATAEADPAVGLDDLPAIEGRLERPVDGPTVLAEPDCTIWVPGGWRATEGQAGALVLRRVGAEPPVT
jgi:N-methylhydantoinase A/oxoprolinase/acetone carboxylase beta subunit